MVLFFLQIRNSAGFFTQDSFIQQYWFLLMIEDRKIMERILQFIKN